MVHVHAVYNAHFLSLSYLLLLWQRKRRTKRKKRKKGINLCKCSYLNGVFVYFILETEWSCLYRTFFQLVFLSINIIFKFLFNCPPDFSFFASFFSVVVISLLLHLTLLWYGFPKLISYIVIILLYHMPKLPLSGFWKDSTPTSPNFLSYQLCFFLLFHYSLLFVRILHFHIILSIVIHLNAGSSNTFDLLHMTTISTRKKGNVYSANTTVNLARREQEKKIFLEAKKRKEKKR